MRSEKDICLRIDLLEGQSNSIAKMLAKAMHDHNDEAVKEYSEKLALIKGRVEELTWVLGIKTGQSVLDVKVDVGGPVTVRELLAMLKDGRVRMDDLPVHAQALAKKGALEMKGRT